MRQSYEIIIFLSRFFFFSRKELQEEHTVTMTNRCKSKKLTKRQKKIIKKLKTCRSKILLKHIMQKVIVPLLGPWTMPYFYFWDNYQLSQSYPLFDKFWCLVSEPGLLIFGVEPNYNVERKNKTIVVSMKITIKTKIVLHFPILTIIQIEEKSSIHKR